MRCPKFLPKNNLKEEIINYSKKVRRSFLIGEISQETGWSLEVSEWCLEILVSEGILKKYDSLTPSYILQNDL